MKSEEQEHQATANVAAFLGWSDLDGPGDDDPAENYHEASKFTPALHWPVVAAARMLETDPRAQATAARSVKRHLHLPSLELPEPDGQAELFETIRRRRSVREYGSTPLSLEDLAQLLEAAYGVTGSAPLHEEQRLRAVPSGGGLFPLDLYPLITNVEDVEPGLYHFDPYRRVLEAIRTGQEVVDEATEVFIVGEGQPPPTTAGVIVLIAGIFWRSRFKYGQRGYRFALIEAGHIGQNLLLSAETLGLAACAVGGFWDRPADKLLGLDGVNESAVYSIVIGSSPGRTSG